MHKQPVRVGFRRFISITQASSTLRMAYSTLRYRCFSTTQRMDNYEALNPIRNRPKKRVKGVVVVARGRRFESIAVAAAFYGVSPSTIRSRIMDESQTSYFLWDEKNKREVCY